MIDETTRAVLLKARVWVEAIRASEAAASGDDMLREIDEVLERYTPKDREAIDDTVQFIARQVLETNPDENARELASAVLSTYPASVKSVLAEAKLISEVHPSKDARAFAKSVLATLSRPAAETGCRVPGVWPTEAMIDASAKTLANGAPAWRAYRSRARASFLAALAAAPPPPDAVPETVWRPIETAPKDGTEVLCRTRSGEVVVAKSFAGLPALSWYARLGERVLPVYWTPLPAPLDTPRDGDDR